MTAQILLLPSQTLPDVGINVRDQYGLPAAGWKRNPAWVDVSAKCNWR